MKRITWHKHHKWFGLCISFFMLMFCLSGIVLNHRSLVADMNVSRKYLPTRYHYDRWNNGLLRGTLPYTGADSMPSILIYGSGGLWQTHADASSITDFNRGLPRGADYRNIRRVVSTPSGSLFAVSPFGLYRCGADGCWTTVSLPLEGDERLTDIEIMGDTLVVVSRSYLYLSIAPYTDFHKIQPDTPDGYDGRVSWFRTVWLLHSGELFGTVGKLVVDGIALILILLCLTGLACWCLPGCTKRLRSRHRTTVGTTRLTRFSLLWHNRIGRWTIVLTLLICLTGWCLRPPVMIPLVMNKMKPLPGTLLSNPNPWHDRLRLLRYDEACGDWLLSTSEGFFALSLPEGTVKRLTDTPPVSVMGLNVLQKDMAGRWLCGSFSGLYVWDRQQCTSTDYFTHVSAPTKSGAPFGQQAISGFSSDFAAGPFPVGYGEGTEAIPQPEELSTLPMSLWNAALEVHSGRIYIGSAATLFFIFVAGLAAMWCLWSGWKLKNGRRRTEN
ncbi:MAG: PepSY domain-containing protein [Bacteroides sp.]|nr:PepSY domain-containing protein [Bacteroides sp.]